MKILKRTTPIVAFKPFYDTCGLAVVLWGIGEGIAYITGVVLSRVKFVVSPIRDAVQLPIIA